jgi:23S rRNA (pseudouridine1915-N3)-methyltransferase
MVYDWKIVAVGEMRSKIFRAVATEYEKRLKPFARLKILETKPIPFGVTDKERAKTKEVEKLSEILEKEEKNKVFLLDADGDKLNSEKFAELVEKNQGLVLVLGGALGFSEDFKKKYKRVSLSSLTMPHELARVVLLEQLYRAAAKLRGKTYDY